MNTQDNLVQIEQEIRRFWQRYEVPEATARAHLDGAEVRIVQQPLAVAGQPRAEQVRLLALSDLLARYRSMRGYRVHCQRGWSCHGVPVELAVEGSLQPEGLGVDLARFTAACRDEALRGLRAGEALAAELGVWIDPEDSYATLTPGAIAATWAAVKRLWDGGLLHRERCVAPVCPRCATPLSTAEAGRHRVGVQSRSIWIQLPWIGEADAYLLAWTPAPWTLVGWVALAAHPDARYALVEWDGPDQEAPLRLLLAEDALDRTLPGGYRLVRRIKGKALRTARYRTPFSFLATDQRAGRIVLSKDVPLDSGTGLLPVTPAFDALALAIASAHDLPVPELLDDWGRLDASVTPWRGLAPHDAEPLLVDALHTWGLLFQEQPSTQQRALCPYCQTAILPLARTVWTVPTPDGPWILGRDRAWGAPLPVWSCTACDHEECVAGLDDLAQRTGLASDQIDPHRPEVDRLTIPCTACGGTMVRTGAVLDPAFEAAALSLTYTPEPGPADLVLGLGDGQHGWPADLGTAADLLGAGSAAWQIVLQPDCRPEPAGEAEWTGSSSAVRWAVYSGLAAQEAEETFLQPLWRMAVELASSRPGTQAPDGKQQLLDRWLRARLAQSIKTVTEALDQSRIDGAAGELQALAADMGWYAAHRPGEGHRSGDIFCHLLAPFVPHLAEAIYRKISGPTLDSIHGNSWPVADPDGPDPTLLAQVHQARRLAGLGQEARRGAGLPPDRPLRRALVSTLTSTALATADEVPFLDLLAELLDVAEVQPNADTAAQVVWQIDLIPEQAQKRGASGPAIAAALASLPHVQAAELAAQLRSGLSVRLESGEGACTLLPDEVQIAARARAGWAAAADGGWLVVLQAD